MTKRYLPEQLPLPAVNDFNRDFFTSGRLLLQTCAVCRSVQHPPGEVCFSCGSQDFESIETAAVGVVSSYTVVHHPTHPTLKDRVPYNVVLVELSNHPGVRIVGNVVDAEPAAVAIGLPVRGEWTEPLGADGVRLLQWRLT